MNNTQPLLYHELAEWWPLMSAPEDYEEEAEFYRSTLFAACPSKPVSMLELGSGGGNNASHIKKHVNMTLVDLAPGMIEVSKHLNPECEHVVADIRSVRLGQEFDCVFVHDAICYMTDQSELRQAIETAYIHCKTGGAVLFAPDDTKETFCNSTSHGGHDGDDRALRYLEWTWDPDPDDETYVVDYVYVLRNSDGNMETKHERHTEGLFTQQTWLTLMSDVGFEPRRIPFKHSELPDDELQVFVGTKNQ